MNSSLDNPNCSAILFIIIDEKNKVYDIHDMDNDVHFGIVGYGNNRKWAKENMNKYVIKFLYGGHIGYSVRPSKRKQGIGTKMLKDFLPICVNDYHLKKVLITCHKDNEGSRRIILNNGGKYEKDIYYPADNTYLERYWISL